MSRSPCTKPGNHHQRCGVKGSYDRLKPKGEKFLSFDFSGGMALEELMILIHKKGLAF